MNPGDAVMKLTRHGFRFRLDGEAVKVRYEGEQKPDPETVTPLLDLVHQHKDEVRYFLRSYCPRCGGVCFIGSLCMVCDWGELVEMYPDLKVKQ
jgi:hypothetical protein